MAATWKKVALADDVVTKSLFNAHTVLYAVSDDTPLALTVNEQYLVGRVTGGNIAGIAITNNFSSVSANDDNVPSTKSVNAALAAKAPLSSPAFTDVPTAPTAANGTNNTQIATTAFVTAAVADVLGTADAMIYKGVQDCSGNPNYPAGNAGWTYKVSVAGKIGGASGIAVEAGDMFICTNDGTSTGDQAGVGANWNVIQKNIDGAVSGPASSVDNTIPRFDSTSGKIIQGSNVTIDDSDHMSVPGNINITTGHQYLINNAALAYGDVGAAAANHATQHKSGGGDAIRLDELAIPSSGINFNSVNLNNMTLGTALNFNGQQAQDMVLHITANNTTMGALTGVVGKIVWNTAEAGVYICTAL